MAFAVAAMFVLNGLLVWAEDVVVLALGADGGPGRLLRDEVWHLFTIELSGVPRRRLLGVLPQNKFFIVSVDVSREHLLVFTVVVSYLHR